MRYLLCLACAWVLLTACCLAGVRQPRAFDFDGPDRDGRSRDDLSLYYRGRWFIVSPLPAPFIATMLLWGWSEADPVPGDYDGDGKADLAVFDRIRGDWYIATLSPSLVMFWQHNWGWNGTMPVFGDYDGDGKSDFAVYHRQSGRWFIKSSAGPVLVLGEQWGWDQAMPVPGDYDGDGKADMAIFHRPSGTWYIRSVDGRVLVNGMNWGWKDSWPVPGDFDGDGKSDLAVYQRALGAWYIRGASRSPFVFGDRWGGPGLAPLGLDYDGDGTTDLGAVDCRSACAWYIKTVAGTVLESGRNWGLPHSVAVQTYGCQASVSVSILAFGDSITYGTGSSANGPSTGYPVLLERRLREEYGGWINVINGGSPGETSWRGQSRVAGLLDANQPDVVLLLEGSDDARTDDMFDATESSIRNIVRASASRGIPVVLATVPPVTSTPRIDNSEQMAQISLFNPTVYAIADSYGFRVAEAFQAITGVAGWESRLMNLSTARHPNDAGYLRIRDAFFTEVESGLLNGDLY